MFSAVTRSDICNIEKVLRSIVARVWPPRKRDFPDCNPVCAAQPQSLV
jgi:hypothetical protein